MDFFDWTPRQIDIVFLIVEQLILLSNTFLIVDEETNNVIIYPFNFFEFIHFVAITSCEQFRLLRKHGIVKEALPTADQFKILFMS